jgi:hypothetical protein
MMLLTAEVISHAGSMMLLTAEVMPGRTWLPENQPNTYRKARVILAAACAEAY